MRENSSQSHESSICPPYRPRGGGVGRFKDQSPTSNPPLLGSVTLDSGQNGLKSMDFVQNPPKIPPPLAPWATFSILADPIPWGPGAKNPSVTPKLICHPSGAADHTIFFIDLREGERGQFHSSKNQLVTCIFFWKNSQSPTLGVGHSRIQEKIDHKCAKNGYM